MTHGVETAGTAARGDDAGGRAAPGTAQRTALVRIGGVILVILLGWVLRATAIVTVPIVFAVFLAVVLAPVDRIIAARLPDAAAWLGRAAVVAVLLVALTVFFGGLVYAAQQVIDEVPRISDRLRSVLPDAVAAVEEMSPGGTPGKPATDGPGAAAPAADPAENGAGVLGSDTLGEALNRAVSVAGSWLVEGAAGLARQVAGAVGAFVAATVIVVFMVLLALGESDRWQRKIETLWPSASPDWQDAVAAISRKLRGFLLVRAAMGALTATLYAAWLWVFDIGLLSVWAVLTFLLSFVPNLGSLVSGVLPTLYALVTRDVQTALIAGLGLFAIEQVIGNFLDPRLQGRQIAISPLVVLVSVLVWGWIWGAAGALLAVPIMLGLIVTFAHVAALRPVALLLSNQTDHAGLDRSLRS